MSSLCPQCTGMTIQRLVELAKTEYRANFFPGRGFYHHHDSFAELERCAAEWPDTATRKRGCPLCRLIVECFQHTQHDPSYPLWPSMGAGWTGQNPGVVSVADAARKLQKTDIRVALYSRHMATGGEIERVRMFDILMVQVGDFQETSNPMRLPNLPLVIRSSPTPAPRIGQTHLPPLVGGFKIGCLDVDTDVGSESNLQLARHWLDTCLQGHSGCRRSENEGPPRLPTRVVDVDSNPPRIVYSADVNLGTENHGRAEYVALSHCWGGPISLTLTSATIASFLESLPVSQLPANFRDAMEITKSLGIRYLWIDSLCIVQDVSEDWLHEARLMGDVYGQATVSLLAMSAKGSSAGLLHPKTAPSSAHTFDRVTIRVTDDNSGTEVPLVISAVDRYEENLRILDEKGPLGERGWTLQELVMSARILFFGERQIYWYCPTAGYHSADGQPHGNSFPYEKYPHLGVGLYSGLPDPKEDRNSRVNAIFHDYYSLLRAYSHRRLTYESDKLPALSGLAQHVYRALVQAAGVEHAAEFTYLAGLWSADIGRGLLFYPDGMHCPHVKGDYRAPSWSWAVTDAPIMFIAPDWHMSRKPHPLNMKLCSAQVALLDPQNSFGPVTAGHLIVEGRVGSLRRSCQEFRNGPYSWDNYDEAGSAWFDEPPAGGVGPNPFCLIFRGGTRNAKSREEGDMLLSVYVCSRQFVENIGSEKRIGLEVDWEQYEEQEYTLLLVDMGGEDEDKEDSVSVDDDEEDDDDDWEIEERQIHCLILKQVQRGQGPPDSDGAFERVGSLVLEWKNKSYVEKWPSRIIKLV